MTDYRGHEATDVITGFKGVVTAHSQHLNNCDRVCIQPRELNEDGSPKDNHWFDVTNISFSLAPVHELMVKPLVAHDFKMKDLVRDTLGKHKGTITQIANFMNGCVRIGVQSKELTKDGVPVEEIWTPVQQLELVKASKQEEPKQRTGGPMNTPRLPKDPKF